MLISGGGLFLARYAQQKTSDRSHPDVQQGSEICLCHSSVHGEYFQGFSLLYQWQTA